MKENYPDLLDEAMKFVYENISKDLNHENPFHEFGNDAKYYLFLCMVRARYLTKISKNTSSFSKFEFLYQNWKEELDKRFENNEKEFSNEFLDRLTDIDHPLRLGSVYYEFLDHIWKN